MEKIYSLNDTINIGKRQKIQVSDIVKVKGEISKLIKKGYQFDDEVLKEAHITKIVNKPIIKNSFASHQTEKKKELGKDTENLKSILNSLNTLENQTEDVFNTENDSLIDD